MSVRSFSPEVRRFGLVAAICLACVWASRAGDLSTQPIEIVPLRGTTLNTNVDQSQAGDTPILEALSPHAQQSLRPPPRVNSIQLPRPQIAPNQSEKDLLDRRRNWVFMTPEDMVSSDSDKDSGKDENQMDGKSTVMQRYYQRLYDSDHPAATNESAKMDPFKWTAETNSTGSGLRAEDRIGIPQTPFDSRSDADAFRSARPNVFSDIFGSERDANTSDPEAVRAQAEQKTHLDNFKQLWNIDQPPAAAIVDSAPAPVVSTDPLFGPQNAQSAFNAASSVNGGRFQNQQATPVQPTITSSRAIAPPHADFAPPQRPF